MAGSVRFAALIAPFHEYKDVKPGPAGLPLVGSLGLVFLLRFVVRAGSVRRFLNMRRNPSIDNARAPVASMPRRRCNVSIRAQVISSSVSARTRISPSLHSTRSRRSSSSPAQRATAAPAADQPPAAQPIFRSAARQSPGSPRLPCVRSFLPVRSASPRRSALRRSRSRCHSRLFSAFSPGTRTTAAPQAQTARIATAPPPAHPHPAGPYSPASHADPPAGSPDRSPPPRSPARPAPAATRIPPAPPRNPPPPAPAPPDQNLTSASTISPSSVSSPSPGPSADSTFRRTLPPAKLPTTPFALAISIATAIWHTALVRGLDIPVSPLSSVGIPVLATLALTPGVYAGGGFGPGAQ